MDCQVACQLDRIADALEGWDWNAFTATLIATIVGALFALLGAAWLAKRDRRERYETRLTDAIVAVSTALTDDMLAILRYAQDGNPDEPGFIGTNGKEFFNALGTAQRVARGEDAETLAALYLAMMAYMDGKPSERAEILGEVDSILGHWRMRNYDHATARRKAEELAARFAPAEDAGEPATTEA